MALNLASRSAIVRCSSVAVRRQGPTAAILVRNSFQSNVPRVCFSTTEQESPGIFDRLRGGFEARTKRQQQEKYKEQIQTMANSERWTLKNFSDQLNAAMPTGWRSKLPGSNTQEAQAAKQTQSVLAGIIDEIGNDASMQELEKLGRKEKLRISLKSGLDVEDINIMIQQFKSMEIMHKVLRQRKSEGKPLPETEEGMMGLVQGYSAKVMTREQKKDLQERRMKKMRGAGRR
mmetsp:Transcript_12773/g.18143  ORF Transcript_12773/g.18143 Transcript_12773/m.18143 type:complete len:232 (-) Transcript_12773:39-734(-)